VLREMTDSCRNHGLWLLLLLSAISAVVMWLLYRDPVVRLPGCTVVPVRHEWVATSSDSSIGWFEFDQGDWGAVMPQYPFLSNSGGVPSWAIKERGERRTPKWIGTVDKLDAGVVSWGVAQSFSGVHISERWAFWKTGDRGYVLYIGVD